MQEWKPLTEDAFQNDLEEGDLVRLADEPADKAQPVQDFKVSVFNDERTQARLPNRDVPSDMNNEYVWMPQEDGQ